MQEKPTTPPSPELRDAWVVPKEIRAKIITLLAVRPRGAPRLSPDILQLLGVLPLGALRGEHALAESERDKHWGTHHTPAIESICALLNQIIPSRAKSARMLDDYLRHLSKEIHRRDLLTAAEDIKRLTQMWNQRFDVLEDRGIHLSQSLKTSLLTLFVTNKTSEHAGLYAFLRNEEALKEIAEIFPQVNVPSWKLGVGAHYRQICGEIEELFGMPHDR